MFRSSPPVRRGEERDHGVFLKTSDWPKPALDGSSGHKRDHRRERSLCFCLIFKSLPPAVSRRGGQEPERRNVMVRTSHLIVKNTLHRVFGLFKKKSPFEAFTSLRRSDTRSAAKKPKLGVNLGSSPPPPRVGVV